MPFLFRDPVGWSLAAVETPATFGFIAVVLAFLQLALVQVAIESGWHTAWVLAALLGGNNFMFLFALRRMYMKFGLYKAIDRAA